jgi:hypothetical protein
MGEKPQRIIKEHAATRRSREDGQQASASAPVIKSNQLRAPPPAPRPRPTHPGNFAGRRPAAPHPHPRTTPHCHHPRIAPHFTPAPPRITTHYHALPRITTYYRALPRITTHCQKRKHYALPNQVGSPGLWLWARGLLPPDTTGQRPPVLVWLILPDYMLSPLPAPAVPSSQAALKRR